MADGLGLSALAQYKVVTKRRDQQMQQFERQPDVKRNLAAFNERAPKIDSVDALLKDRKTLTVVLSAFQLEDSLDQIGLLRKIISQSPDDDNSLANRLNDQRYKRLAAALHGLVNGDKVLADDASKQAIVNSYKTNEFEKYQGDIAGGMREAMYFDRNIASVTSTFQVIASKPMLEVVRVALGLPQEISLLPVAKQKEIIDKRVDIKKFADDGFRQRFIDRYLAKKDVEASQANAATSGLIGLFNTGQQGSSGTISLLV